MANQNSPQPPEFIKFLFSDKPKFDCHFIVGDESLAKPERIGAVKLMLVAHSPVFRNELEESDLRVKEKEAVQIKDIDPDTFRNLLKYVYGYDTINYLEFDEADNLFYVADKYMIPDLKNKLAERLIPLITPENICSLLNNPACRNDLLLKSNITQILRYETDKVLASPTFLEVCADGFVVMLEQNGLAVAEIELWRAAVEWAKHNSNSEDCQVLRQQLSGVTEQIRVCTLSSDQFYEEVVSTGILSDHEVVLAVKSIWEKTIIEEVTSFSNNLEPREMLYQVIFEKLFDAHDPHAALSASKPWQFYIDTKKSAIELMPFTFSAENLPSSLPQGSIYSIDFKLFIYRYSQQYNCWETMCKRTVREVEYGKTFTVPFSADGGGVVLLPNTRYKIIIISNATFKWWKQGSDDIENEHMIVWLSDGVYCPIRSMRYKVRHDMSITS